MLASGIAAIFSVISKQLSGGQTGSSYWLILNALQAVEMLSLVELNYPNPLLLYFEGFQFTLLGLPEEWNLLKILLEFIPGVRVRETTPISKNYEERGFYSNYFLV